jgi:hypothetical protein
VAEQRLFVQVTIDALAEGELRAHVRGAEVEEWRLLPRGHTLPELDFELRPEGLEATVTLAA